MGRWFVMSQGKKRRTVANPCHYPFLTAASSGHDRSIGGEQWKEYPKKRRARLKKKESQVKIPPEPKLAK
ncbi:hypothetical protein TNCV_1345121 [Trichonephila clavipes]|nr:hypothetical protein TNCV_1345121 [Trichonephila clavipes]